MLKTLTTEEIKLLQLLEENSLCNISDIARKVNLSEEKTSALKDKLEKEEIILKYKAIVNWEKIEHQEVNAIIQVSVTPSQGQGYDKVAKTIAQFEEVSTVLLVSGSFDLLIEASGASLKDVAFFVADKLATIDGVQDTRTNFLLKRYKQGGDLLTVSGKTHRLPIVI